MQSLKVLDTSVENFASGAWQALGSAWRGGSNLVHKYDALAFLRCVFFIINGSHDENNIVLLKLKCPQLILLESLNFCSLSKEVNDDRLLDF